MQWPTRKHPNPPKPRGLHAGYLAVLALILLLETWLRLYNIEIQSL